MWEAIHIWTPGEIAEGAAVFHAAFALWKAIKKFDPVAAMQEMHP